MRIILTALLITLATNVWAEVKQSFNYNGLTFKFETDGLFCEPTNYPDILNNFENVRVATIAAGKAPNVVHYAYCGELSIVGNNYYYPSLWIKPQINKGWGPDLDDKTLERLASENLGSYLSKLSKEDFDNVISDPKTLLEKATESQISVEGKPFVISESPVISATILTDTLNEQTTSRVTFGTLRAAQNEIFYIYVAQPLGNYGYPDIDYQNELLRIAKSLF